MSIIRGERKRGLILNYVAKDMVDVLLQFADNPCKAVNESNRFEY